MDTATKIVARIVGAILLILGAASIALGAYGIKRQVDMAWMRGVEFTTVFGIALLFALGGWLAVMGFRLATDRPNRHGSLLPPGGWYVVALAMSSIGIVLAITALRKMDWRQLGASGLAFLFGWWCWQAARKASGKTIDEESAIAPWGPKGNSRKGYYRLLTFRDIPVFVHRSLPFGGLLFAAYAGFDSGNILYYCLGYFLLVSLHEAAHAVAARMVGLKVFAIDISGIGGMCHVEVTSSVSRGVIVFSAGIVIQVMLLALTLGYGSIVGEPSTEIGKSLYATFTIANIVTLIFNIIPVTTANGFGTDGKMVWDLIQHARGERAHPFKDYIAKPAEQSPVLPRDTSLLNLSHLVPKDFKQGVEVLNDDTTPMQFVMNCFRQHLGMSEKDALLKMLSIHNNGGILIPLESAEKAAAAAAAIAEDAKKAGYPFTCRMVVRD